MRFLYFVEKNYRIGRLTNLVHQQTAFFIAHVSRRCTIEQGYGVFLLEFRHIETQQGALVAEQELSQRL